MAGRDPDAVKVMAAAPAHVGDPADGRDRTRWFPALVGNHVVDLVNRYPREDLPEELTTYVRGREGYDYLHHAEVGSSNAGFVTDESSTGSASSAGRSSTSRGCGSWPPPASTSSTST